MRKQGFWIAAFLLLAFIGDRFGGYILQHTTERSQFRYSRLYYSNQEADILFVGNSRGLTFFQPEVEKVTGLKTINISYNGMPADLAKTLVMDYLDRHKAPKTMVVDVTLCDRENDILKSGFNLYTPASTRLTQLIRNIGLDNKNAEVKMEHANDDVFAGRKVYYGGKVSHLYRFNSEIFQRVLYHYNLTDEDWLIDRVLSENGATNKDDMVSYKVRMFPHMVAHLKELIAYAQSKGVEVKLVINPYFPAFAEAIRDSFLTPLKTYVETQTGLPVSDFSTILTEREEIGDYQHANKKGSARYMQILMAEGFFNQNNLNTSPTLGGNSDINASFKVETEQGTPVIPPSVSAPNSDNSAIIVPVVATHYEVLKEKRSVKKGIGKESWIAVDTLF